MNINIDTEIVDKATNDMFSALIQTDNYNNPIKKILEQEFGYDMNGTPKTELGKQLKEHVQTKIAQLLADPEFYTMLGQQIASKFAEQAVKDLRTLKEINRK